MAPEEKRTGCQAGRLPQLSRRRLRRHPRSATRTTTPSRRSLKRCGLGRPASIYPWTVSPEDERAKVLPLRDDGAFSGRRGSSLRAGESGGAGCAPGRISEGAAGAGNEERPGAPQNQRLVLGLHGPVKPTRFEARCGLRAWPRYLPRTAARRPAPAQTGGTHHLRHALAPPTVTRGESALRVPSRRIRDRLRYAVPVGESGCGHAAPGQRVPPAC